MFSLNGKTALITGSGRGIGLAIAEAMAHQGANIFLSDINSSVVERAAGELAEEYPNVAVRGLTFDVTDKAQIESAMQAIKDAGNGLQILVNNAGINLREPVADMDDALWQKMLDTNLTSVFRVSRAAFPMLKEKGGKVDYIHGAEVIRELSAKENPILCCELFSRVDSLCRTCVSASSTICTHFRVDAVFITF